MSQPNRIQYYRKKLGLSQEELGEKVLVSRQTVSQWENGQTVPSVDSLICLRDIFGVSVDDILGLTPDEEEQAKDDTDIKYTFRMNGENEFKNIKYIRYRLLIPNIIFFGILFVIVLLWTIESQNIASAICLGMVSVFICSLISLIRNLRKSFKANKTDVIESTHTYSLSKNGIVHTVTRDSDPEFNSRELIRDILRVRITSDYCFIETKAYFYTLRRADITDETPLGRYILTFNKNRKSAVPKNKSEKRLINLSSVFLVLSSLSIFGGMILSGLISSLYGNSGLGTEGFWAMFLLLPIPIITVILGYIMNNKGFNGQAHILIGIAVCIILALFGSMSFSFKGIENPVEAVEAELHIDIPEYKYYNSSANAGFVGKKTVFCRIEFPSSSAESFEASFDSRWLTEPPEGLEDKFPRTSPTSSHFLIYDRELGICNDADLPLNSYIALVYDEEYKTLVIYLCNS